MTIKSLPLYLCMLCILGLQMLLFGCRGVSRPFFSPDFEPEGDPEWVFTKPGRAVYEEQEVILAVGVADNALSHTIRRENALRNAREKLKEAIENHIQRKETEILHRLQLPEELAETFRETLSKSATSTAARLAELAEKVKTHENMLRKEEFVKVTVPLELVNSRYHMAARQKLENRLGDKDKTEAETNVLLERFDRALTSTH